MHIIKSYNRFVTVYNINTVGLLLRCGINFCDLGVWICDLQM